MSNCELCGEPMPVGEEMFKYHGYSGPCPKPPIGKTPMTLSLQEKLAKVIVPWIADNVQVNMAIHGKDSTDDDVFQAALACAKSLLPLLQAEVCGHETHVGKTAAEWIAEGCRDPVILYSEMCRLAEAQPVCGECDHPLSMHNTKGCTKVYERNIPASEDGPERDVEIKCSCSERFGQAEVQAAVGAVVEECAAIAAESYSRIDNRGLKIGQCGCEKRIRALHPDVLKALTRRLAQETVKTFEAIGLATTEWLSPDERVSTRIAQRLSEHSDYLAAKAALEKAAG